MGIHDLRIHAAPFLQQAILLHLSSSKNNLNPGARQYTRNPNHALHTLGTPPWLMHRQNHKSDSIKNQFFATALAKVKPALYRSGNTQLIKIVLNCGYKYMERALKSQLRNSNQIMNKQKDNICVNLR